MTGRASGCGPACRAFRRSVLRRCMPVPTLGSPSRWQRCVGVCGAGPRSSHWEGAGFSVPETSLFRRPSGPQGPADVNLRRFRYSGSAGSASENDRIRDEYRIIALAVSTWVFRLYGTWHGHSSTCLRRTPDLRYAPVWIVLVRPEGARNKYRRRLWFKLVSFVGFSVVPFRDLFVP